MFFLTHLEVIPCLFFKLKKVKANLIEMTERVKIMMADIQNVFTLPEPLNQISI